MDESTNTKFSLEKTSNDLTILSNKMVEISEEYKTHNDIDNIKIMLEELKTIHKLTMKII